MDLALLVAAAAVLVTGGAGLAAMLLADRERVAAAELFALAVLLGIFAGSLALVAVTLVAPFAAAVPAVAFAALATAAGGAWRWRRRPPAVEERRFGALAVLTAAVLAVMLAWRLGIAWDGLFVWEMKARAFASEDGFPWSYLADASRAWSQPHYPLLVPAGRTFLAAFTGGAHEGAARLLDGLFLAAGAALLVAPAGRRDRIGGVVALLLVASTPLVLAGPGSATSGYADFPLGLFYAGAVLYALRAATSGEAVDLRIAGLLGAALPWTKQDGLVLFAAFLVVAAVAFGRRAPRALVALATPGVLVAGGWAVLMTVAGVQPPPTFASVTALPSRLGLVSEVLPAMVRWTTWTDDWALLWLLTAVAVLVQLRPAADRGSRLLAVAVMLPLPVWATTYLLSNWQPVTLHVDSSFPRLLLHLAVPAILLVARSANAALPRGLGPADDGGPRG